jgi:hypothetical protein
MAVQCRGLNRIDEGKGRSILTAGKPVAGFAITFQLTKYVLENLKMKLKALAAVVALAFAGSANAAFETDGMPGIGAGTGAGSVVLSVVDDTATTDSSIAIDLGILSSDILNGAVSMGTMLSNHAELNSFLSSATGTVKWDITAIINDGTSLDMGMLQTVVGGVMPTHNDADAFNAMGGQSSWMDGIRGVAGSNTWAIFADATQPGGHYGPGSDYEASVNSYVTDAALGDTVDFLAILAGYGATHGFGTDLEDFTLAWDGSNATLTYGAASVVPVPAAAWLFGSAMLGMVGVARRKAA